MYPQIKPINERQIVRLQNIFIQYGSNLKASQTLPKPIISNEDNILNVLGYLYRYPEASIHSAEKDLVV